MFKTDDLYTYSPSDLIKFVENEAVCWLDRYDLERPGALTCDEDSEEDRIISEAGDRHEKAFVERLVAEGRDLANVRHEDEKLALELTLEAMKKGRDFIYQARLELDPFKGWADFLVKVEGASKLGSYHYEVWDTKLARSMKPYFAVQLCCYAEMLAAIQGPLPEYVGIVLGNGEQERLRTQDYFYYYQAIKRDFLEQQRAFDAEVAPAFAGKQDYRRWSSHVEQILAERDDLSLVAGIRSSQIQKLSDAGVSTTAQLAAPTLEGVSGIAPESLWRLKEQARLQIESRGCASPKYTLVEIEPGARNGLALLPPPSPSDLCFDIEGYPLVENGLEYLLGVTCSENGRLRFRDWWAHDSEQEKSSFQTFVRWVHARWRSDPSMHVYHYAAYETSALKRLMCRYACCEQEVDDLLRNGVFVDLYKVVRQGLVVGEPSYSLKNIERLYRPTRTGDVSTAGGSVVYYHRWRESRDGDTWESSSILRSIRTYNQADCDSTWALVEWLRNVQRNAGITYMPPADADEHQPSEKTTERGQLAASMLANVPPDVAADPERLRVHSLLAHLLEFHRRAEKPVWWLLFERSSMTEEELVEDPDCLGGLRQTSRPPERVKQSFLYEYSFDKHQESKLRDGSMCCMAHDIKAKITVETVDYDRGLLTFKWGKGRVPPERFSLIPHEIVPSKEIVASIERTVGSYLSNGDLPQALSDFLYRRNPRLRGRSGPVIQPGQGLLVGCIQAGLDLDDSALCIQGPPGSGKTYAAARMIAVLLRAGKRVGVTSNSHRAICLLMREAATAAESMGVSFSAAKAGTEEDDEQIHPRVAMLEKNGDLLKLDTLPDLVGGTAWLFSREAAAGQFDYLFIDEAGQVSVANLVSMAPATRNIVLVGDQMQLNQPVQGIHPGESGQSTLEYLLRDLATIPNELGIFLAKTWRMRPEVCEFISEGVYDGRLTPEMITSQRSLDIEQDGHEWVFPSAGVVYLPIEHDGNSYESVEEADAMVEMVRELEGQELHLPGGGKRALTRDDILVVAPYNLQVRVLSTMLPGVRVGTVDKFQGQEAPVVIFSMTASTGDASPRGIEFLFSKNRLNVAISRAQILALVVASSKLIRTRCSRLEQIPLVNLFCRVALRANGRWIRNETQAAIAAIAAASE